MEPTNLLSETSKFALQETSVHTSGPSPTPNVNFSVRPTLGASPANLERNEIRSLIADHDLASFSHVIQAKYILRPSLRHRVVLSEKMSGGAIEYSVPELLRITIVAMLGSIDRNRLPWLLLAIVLMFGSAICALLYLGTMGAISGWIGLQEYEGFVPRLQWHARLWSALAVIFPFLAAFLLGLGKGAGSRRPEISRPSVISAPDVSNEQAAMTAVLAYLLRVSASALVSLAFIVVFILAVALLGRVGVLAH